ncbi:hypothetical protein [Streptomyces sp. NPDC058872]|uniref:hypothetical protein n=1 Tax=Streptomyces sp. NPDC058872 TaxID=3346661 RepID=UPI0036B3D142
MAKVYGWKASARWAVDERNALRSPYRSPMDDWLMPRTRGIRDFPTYEYLKDVEGKSDEGVIKGAANTNKGVDTLNAVSKWGGRGLLGLEVGVGVGVGVYNVATAPEGEKVQTAARETGGIVGGLAGRRPARCRAPGRRLRWSRRRSGRQRRRRDRKRRRPQGRRLPGRSVLAVTQRSQESVVSVLVTDTTGVSFAEIRAGELHRLHPVPGRATGGVGSSHRAVRHARGLSVLTRIQESNVPLLTGPADGTGLLPVPVTPGGAAPTLCLGVTADGTALATVKDRDAFPAEALYALDWGAGEWRPVEVPPGFVLHEVVSSTDGVAHVVGGVSKDPADVLGGERPALFAVDTARGTVTELPLPAAGPARPRWTRWLLPGTGPGPAALEHGTFHDGVLVAALSYGHAFEYEVLHAVHRERGTWSTAELRRDEAVTAHGVDARGTAYAVTTFGNLWTSRAGGPWRRTSLRSRLAELLGAAPSREPVTRAAFADGRLLLAADGAVLALGPDGSGGRVLCRYDEGTTIHAFVTAPAGTVPVP